MERVLEPEWLDELPAKDARAQTSRTDLHRLNRLMGHATMIARALAGIRQAKRIADLGGGDGTLMLRVARKLGWRGVEVLLVDRQAVLSATTRQQFGDLGCSVTIVEQDVLAEMAALPDCDAMVANLFLHHFSDEELRKLFSRARDCTKFFFACEPRRCALALAASKCLRLMGCNVVTRHDAVISVRAGFRGQELAQLWLAAARWSLREREAGLFSHCFAAQRI